MNFKRLLYIVFFLLVKNVNGQIFELRGKITNEENVVISGVYVTVSKSLNGPIILYTKTSLTGEFKLENLPDTDSLWISTAVTGYEKSTIRINSQSSFLQISLRRVSKELGEIVIKPQIIKKGDTLSYDVGSFKRFGDRSIADVINRIPGLEVDLSGRITYQGNAIEKFYIEGLDLMGGRYGIVNNNLSADKVDRVEVLENHQSIKMLEDISLSEKASINIKLKNKVTTLFPISLGVGGTPASYDVNITPMVFSPKNQFLGSILANNIGNNIALQSGGNSKFSISENNNLVDVQNAPSPVFSERRWRFNKSALGSINYLYLTKKLLELRFNASGLLNYTNQEFKNETHFSIPGGQNVSLIEESDNKFIERPIQISFRILKNTKEKHLNNHLEFSRALNINVGDLVRNEESITQKAKVPYTRIANNYTNMLKIGNNILNINSTISYERLPQNLFVSSNSQIFALNYNLIDQSVKREDFLANASVGMFFLIKGFTLNSNSTLQLERKRFNSDLHGDDSISLGQEYRNNLKYERTFLLLENSLEKKTDKWYLKTTAPISLQEIYYFDFSHSRKENVINTPFEPSLLIRYSYKNNWKFHYNIKYAQSYGDIDAVQYGYSLTSYRTLIRKDLPIPETKGITNSFGINYNNPFLRIAAYITGSVNQLRNNILLETEIMHDGSSQLTGQLESNKSNVKIINGGVSYSLSEIDMRIKYTGSWTQNQRILLLNEYRTYSSLNSFNNSFLISYFPWDRISLNFETTIRSYFNKISENINLSVDNFKYDIKGKVNLLKNQIVWINAEYNTNSSTKNNALFLDGGYRFIFPNKKIELEFSVQNLLNQSKFVYESLSTFNDSRQIYYLRPIQFVTTLRWVISP